MNIFFIIGIILGITALVSFICAKWMNFDICLGIGVLCIVVGVMFCAGGASVNQDRFNDESVKICDSKGGTVSKDNHCMVNGKPVEFSPGIWQRN
jgi:hypothetical protein